LIFTRATEEETRAALEASSEKWDKRYPHLSAS